ncbi:hypothetical protein KEM55_006540 [Ascosphaera atra]|nr:hypothetical protein KEM55_006540 [Ascosphaera atra]
MEGFVEKIQEKFHHGEDQEGGSHDHHTMHVAGAALAGVAVGAAGLYAGEKIHEGWEEKKDDIEEDVRDLPENAAEWTGEKVGDVEGWGDNVKEGFEEKKDNVEEFGERVDGAYDEGKEEGRYD